MRLVGMVHGHLFPFLSITMYLWDSRACTYASGRTRSFYVCIMLIYAKGLHLRSGPLCHDALHSLCHIKIKLHLTYSALSRSKSISIILTSPHLIFCFHLILHHHDHVFWFTKSFSSRINAFLHHPALSMNFLWLSTWLNLILTFISPYLTKYNHFWWFPSCYDIFPPFWACTHSFGSFWVQSGWF